jgi:hypothetical protein
MNYNRKNIIDGLPTSYDFNYVLKTNKKCFFCQKKINQFEIENNSIICTEEFEFIHKDCVGKNGFEIVHYNPKDLSSLIKLKKVSVILYGVEQNNTEKINTWQL